MFSFSNLVKLSIPLLSLAGTIGGGSYGLIALLGDNSKVEVKDSGQSKSQNKTPETRDLKPLVQGPEGTKQEAPLTQEEPKKRIIDPNKVVSEVFYKKVEESDTEEEEWMSCYSKKYGEDLGVPDWGWPCKYKFLGIWNRKKEEKPDMLLRIEKEETYNALGFYFGVDGIENNLEFFGKLKNGLTFGRKKFCKTGWEESNGEKIIVLCEEKTSEKGNIKSRVI
ncbi:hypothetical protein [Mycoplasma suis]|uniref:Uncharacterized protein n=1 Tax=Mycoplasma suis (strain Illinois) TaxID=768700 RepID=F0QQA1_MYCSL|nr:hypothetical protein [Mycoplasma suis]ADX97671.1 hypothetical protein MSU_0127 [Mycoplasma suis str. Illinois]